MTTIIASNLSKKIKKQYVLKDINYTFDTGMIYGLYGRNGSGKTMLLRALAGLIRPSEGNILIDNKKLHEDISFPPSIGVIIENTSLLPQYDAFTNLKILANIKNIASDEDIKEAIKRVGLDPLSKLKVKKFSLGMKQRLSIAQAIFEKPDIILLDEPTNAIDEEGINSIRNLLLKEKDRGATIVIASHNKEDLTILADKKIIMNSGEIVDND
ncbi:ATP-binding cassette domain-containing protein [Priestia megaterium]|jgi:ABC-2 type transport system ATP-binding protein|uniref:ATP-binding cassette domain-containing protein n=1 Tax=Priestia TaxID=2800373 RepID=UPI000BED1FD6|nr:ATP-binding cassette domain-containing protein [Priestia megaterium]MED3854921.1 ATP-binding cassette domain-containing protein [Priestia megaterium]PEB61093.1 multidrug ABC transporter ATP-binding protein [Priestia megaterium]PEE73299.1 multidrug ABC transporter ATP-binding protein [Priestia megaterium]PFI94181.1 multidrug ABC transporter ATP-binding protein [Priestia megaterium]PGR04398.1 multidrug ABC transporter ATP-binding protein [Priestia megaterium]